MVILGTSAFWVFVVWVVIIVVAPVVFVVWLIRNIGTPQAPSHAPLDCHRCGDDLPAPGDRHCAGCAYLHRNHRYRLERGYTHPSLVPLDYLYRIGDQVALVSDSDGYFRRHEGIRFGDVGEIVEFSDDTTGRENPASGKMQKVPNSAFLVRWRGNDGFSDIRTTRDEIAPATVENRRILNPGSIG